VIDEVFPWTSAFAVGDIGNSDKLWRSSGGVEGGWWTSEVNDGYCGSVGILAVIGDLRKSNDVFELIDEVCDDGWCSRGGVEESW